jgi:Cu(I)/Ag(I) efflux system membrane fusion protein
MTDSKLGRHVLTAAAALGLIAVGVAVGVWIIPREAPARDADTRQVLYWYDPMVPDQHFEKPGKSPFMDMQLIPRHAGEPEAAPGVRIDPGMTQNLGVRVVAVERGPVTTTIRASGVIDYNGRDVAVVQARQGGFVDRSWRRAPGDVITAGDPLVDLRVPDWTAALAEYLALRQGDNAIARAARQRLVMLGVSDSVVATAESQGRAPAVFTIRAPITGALTALDARDGMTIAPGAAIATINGLTPVWLTVSVPQAAAAPLQRGDRAVTRLAAFPGETVTGRIEAVLPSANAASRTVEVRVALPNPSGRFRPGMSGDVELSDATPRQALLVPSQAVIRTGKRTVVIVEASAGRFEPVEITMGASMGDRTEVISGLGEGQRVVVSGQFLIDSEASLTGVIARLSASPMANQPLAAHGKVAAIDAAGVTLVHGPVAALNWPAMTMTFRWSASGATPLKVGDEVDFTFHKEGADFVIDTLTRAAGAKP